MAEGAEGELSAAGRRGSGEGWRLRDLHRGKARAGATDHCPAFEDLGGSRLPDPEADQKVDLLQTRRSGDRAVHERARSDGLASLLRATPRPAASAHIESQEPRAGLGCPD